jgi:hypothetical protein
VLIKFKKNCYIIGIWYAERIYLGKVFIYAFKESKNNLWIGKIKYIYKNNSINIHHDEESPHNIFEHHDISQEQMIKICQDRIDELYCTFNHTIDKIMVYGNFAKLLDMSEDFKWLPTLREFTDLKKNH